MRVRHLGMVDYAEAAAAMVRFTESRLAETADELWLLEHPPVYTLGLNGDPRHVLGATAIPIIQTDRGGQVTYHGPGQLVVYTLIDLRRENLGVRSLVSALENAVIGLVRQYGHEAKARRDAPGVYVDEAKIASLGLRVRRGCSYHGLALNVNLDLAPFAGINPCGYPELTVTSLEKLGVEARPEDVMAPLVLALAEQLGYREILSGPPRLPIP